MEVASWIAPYNIVVMTIFIFLLGIPAFVLQTLVPLEFRISFNKRIGHEYYYGVLLAGISILIFYMTLGNSYLYSLCFSSLSNSVMPYSYCWKLLTTCYVIGLFIYSCANLLTSIDVFSKEPELKFDIVGKLSNSILKSVKENLAKGVFYEIDYADLTNIAKANIDDGNFDLFVHKIIECVKISFDNTDFNNTDRIKLLDILLDCIQNKNNYIVRRLVCVLDELSNGLTSTLCESNLNLINNKLNELIRAIGIISVKIDSDYGFSESIQFFIRNPELGESQLYIVDIINFGIKRKRFNMIHEVISFINGNKISDHEISIVSQFSQINEICLKKALRISVLRNWNAEDFEKEWNFNYKIGRLDTVQEIQIFSDLYFRFAIDYEGNIN